MSLSLWRSLHPCLFVPLLPLLVLQYILVAVWHWPPLISLTPLIWFSTPWVDGIYLHSTRFPGNPFTSHIVALFCLSPATQKPERNSGHGCLPSCNRFESPLRLIVFRNVDRFESSVCRLARTADILVTLGAIPVGCVYVVLGAFATQGRKKRAYYIRHACLYVPMNNSSVEKTLMNSYINPSDAAHATGPSRQGSTWCLRNLK